ncbi:unnamed protein product [Euphydryas editha]|uniref:Uncharacterized protein n=1 Tax=Euphydryas editha TaxID=104508 RepID=A0AAU9UVR6_EUPED|nr:unnamed protein product [Euphydryas editha]
MDSIKNTVAELTEQFNNRMTEFQKELKTSVPTVSSSSNIEVQFNAFRSFVLAALENLQRQVELLSRQADEIEMRTRKKILLVHGVPEAKIETSVTLTKMLSERMQLPELTKDSIHTLHRLGQSNSDRPRAILIKFKETSLRNKVWFSKKSLKGSGVTLSEFLTRCRHRIFQTARQRFGVNRCWTRDGTVVVMGPDGTKHRIYSIADLNSIPSCDGDVEVTPAVVGASPPASAKNSKMSQLRSRRIQKK